MKIVLLILPGFTGFPPACMVPSARPHPTAVPISPPSPHRGGKGSTACTQSTGSRDEEEKRVDNARPIFYIGFKGEGEINTCCENTRGEAV